MTQGRSHSNNTQRVKPKDSTDRKVVFKGVLDNPHRVSWPSVPTNVQNSILAHLLDLLDGVAQFHRSCHSRSKKRKRTSEIANGHLHRSTKFRKPCADVPTVDSEAAVEAPSTPLDHAEKPESPLILQSLTYGINTVTQRLERQIETCRPKIFFKSSETIMNSNEPPIPIRYLFVCRADVDPPVLIDHLPHLVATYNVLRPQGMAPIILATLPKGAEATLAQAVGVRRLTCLAIDNDSAVAKERLTMIDSLPPVTASWISSQPVGSYVQTHIKQLRTTAPRDTKAAKEARAAEKTAAKARRHNKKQELTSQIQHDPDRAGVRKLQE